MRVGCSISGGLAIAGGPDFDLRAFARTAGQSETSSDQLRAIAHPAQADVLLPLRRERALERRRIESASRVAHAQDDPAVLAPQVDLEPVHLRVAGGVGERFLEDTVEGDLDWNADGRDLALHGQLGANPRRRLVL